MIGIYLLQLAQKKPKIRNLLLKTATKKKYLKVRTCCMTLTH